MGQYYKIVFFDYDDNKKKIIRLALVPFIGSKLTEHSYIDNDTMVNIELLLSPLSPFYKSRIIWTGDYADNEDDNTNNLYHLSINHINFHYYHNNHHHLFHYHHILIMIMDEYTFLCIYNHLY